MSLYYVPGNTPDASKNDKLICALNGFQGSMMVLHWRKGVGASTCGQSLIRVGNSRGGIRDDLGGEGVLLVKWHMSQKDGIAGLASPGDGQIGASRHTHNCLGPFRFKVQGLQVDPGSPQDSDRKGKSHQCQIPQMIYWPKGYGACLLNNEIQVRILGRSFHFFLGADCVDLPPVSIATQGDVVVQSRGHFECLTLSSTPFS